jgi:hypothetical protein
MQCRVLACAVLGSWVASGADDSKRWVPEIPKVWDEAALAEWVTPVAGLNIRPTHISSKEYYALPVENLRSYPVYMPGREPVGYWDMLQHIGPKPLIESDTEIESWRWLILRQTGPGVNSTFRAQFQSNVREKRSIKCQS